MSKQVRAREGKKPSMQILAVAKFAGMPRELGRRRRLSNSKAGFELCNSAEIPLAVDVNHHTKRICMKADSAHE